MPNYDINDLARTSALSMQATDRMLENVRQAQAQRDRHTERMAEAAEAQLQQANLAVADIVQLIESFEAAIAPEEEVRILIVGGPAGTMFFPERVQPLGSDRVLFAGLDTDGCRVVVMQHVSQMNIMLKAARVSADEARRTDLGFHSPRAAEV